MLQFRIGHVSGKIRCFNKNGPSRLVHTTQLFKKFLQMVKMLDNMLGNNLIKGIIFNGIWKNIRVAVVRYVAQG